LTLASALAVFASCRTFVSLIQRLGLKDPKSNRAYKAFYDLHAFYWEGFLLLLSTHLIAALAHTVIFDKSDLNSYQHVRILMLGLGAAVAGGVIFASCRIPFGSLRNTFKNPKGYLVFYGFHGWFWLIVFAVIGAHFFFAHAHVGFWPMHSM
jgi:hypothetical protein